MERQLLICLLLLLAVSGASWDAAPQDTSLFEDVHVVPLPVQTYGYRGMPGGMVALGDGRLPRVYTQMRPHGQAGGGIGARHSSDQGKAWSAWLHELLRWR